MAVDLQKSAFPFQELVTNTCVISMVLDSDSNLLQANQMFYDAIGYDKDYFENNNLNSLLAEKRNWSHHIDGLQNEENRLTTTLKIFTKNGKPIFIKSNVGYKDGKVYLIGIDVTADEQQKEILEKVTQVVRIGGWTYNPSENEMFGSDCLYEILEISNQLKITKELFLEFVHPDSMDTFKNSSKELYDKHRPYDIEIKLITRNNNVIWVRIVSDLEVFNGEVAYVHGVMQDISKFKNQSIALEETKTNMELALRAMNSGYFTHDLIEDDLVYSSSFRGKMDIPDSLTEQEFRQFIHPEDRDEAFRQHQRELEKEGAYYINAYRMKSFNGKYKHFEVHGFKVFNTQNVPIKLVGNLIDVDDKYRLNQMQDKHRYYMKTLLDNTFVRSIMLDKDWTIIGLDRVTADLFTKRLGYHPVLKKSNFKEILSSHDRLKFNIIKRVLDEGKEYRREVHLELFESDRTFYDALFKPILDYSNEVDGYVFYFFDLTDRLKIQDEFKSFQDKLRTVHHFKNNMITTIGYQVKTPLQGLLETTKSMFEKESTVIGITELLSAQKESAERLMQAFDDIISSSLYEENFYIIKDSIDLSSILEKMSQNAINQTHLKGLNFLFKNFEEHTMVKADPVFLKQAFENLLDHSFKQIQSGSISLVTGVLDNQALITIEDTSMVSPKLQLNEIPGSSRQGSIKKTKNHESLGLGLTFAIKYIEGIGGHVHVQTELGKGTKFVLTIPLEPSN